MKRLAMDDDAVVAAVDRVQQPAVPLTRCASPSSLGESDEEEVAEQTLRRLAGEGRLLHEPVFVEFLSVPSSRSQIDFYRLPSQSS